MSFLPGDFQEQTPDTDDSGAHSYPPPHQHSGLGNSNVSFKRSNHGTSSQHNRNAASTKKGSYSSKDTMDHGKVSGGRNLAITFIKKLIFFLG